MHSKEELENVVPSKGVLKQIWEHSTHQGMILPSSRKPLGYVLGGQPGSGKSVLTETIKKIQLQHHFHDPFSKELF